MLSIIFALVFIILFLLLVLNNILIEKEKDLTALIVYHNLLGVLPITLEETYFGP